MKMQKIALWQLCSSVQLTAVELARKDSSYTLAMTGIHHGQGPRTFILHLHWINTMFIDKTQLHKTEISEVSCLESVCKLLWTRQWTTGFHIRRQNDHLSQVITIKVHKCLSVQLLSTHLSWHIQYGETNKRITNSEVQATLKHIFQLLKPKAVIISLWSVIWTNMNHNTYATLTSTEQI